MAKREQTVLVLQGGGALGAYQAGVYEGIAETGLAPNWIAGVSNCASHQPAPGQSSNAKDYEFSRTTVRQLWQAGLDDVRRSISHRAWLEARELVEGVYACSISPADVVTVLSHEPSLGDKYA